MPPPKHNNYAKQKRNLYLLTKNIPKMKKTRTFKGFPPLLLAALALSMTACGKNGDDGLEVWQCNEPNAYTITMSVDKAEKTANCNVHKTTSGEQFELLFKDGNSYVYSLLSDTSLNIMPLGEFRYYATSTGEVELQYKGFNNTYSGTIDTYKFIK